MSRSKASTWSHRLTTNGETATSPVGVLCHEPLHIETTETFSKSLDKP